MQRRRPRANSATIASRRTAASEMPTADASSKSLKECVGGKGDGDRERHCNPSKRGTSSEITGSIVCNASHKLFANIYNNYCTVCTVQHRNYRIGLITRKIDTDTSSYIEQYTCTYRVYEYTLKSSTQCAVRSKPVRSAIRVRAIRYRSVLRCQPRRAEDDQVEHEAAGGS